MKKSATGSKFNIIDLFRYKSLRMMTLIVIFLDCIFYLLYLAPTLMLNQFNFDIFLNGASIESAQVFAGVLGYFTIYKVPRRLAGCASLLVIMGCSTVLIFIWDQDNT